MVPLVLLLPVRNIPIAPASLPAVVLVVFSPNIVLPDTLSTAEGVVMEIPAIAFVVVIAVLLLILATVLFVITGLLEPALADKIHVISPFAVLAEFSVMFCTILLFIVTIPPPVEEFLIGRICPGIVPAVKVVLILFAVVVLPITLWDIERFVTKPHLPVLTLLQELHYLPVVGWVKVIEPMLLLSILPPKIVPGSCIYTVSSNK